MNPEQDMYFTVVRGAKEPPVFKDKGSRFIGYAFHVETVDQVNGLLQELKAEHRGARHVCYAYRLGADGAVFRANDDGEPSGTAGLPIHNRMLSTGVTDTLLAVVRYFGGVLLGAPGLVAAYRQAARMALEESCIEQRTVEQILDAKFGYGQLSAVMRLVKERDLRIVSQDMRQDCLVRLSVRLSQAEAVKQALEGIFGVQVDG